MLNPYTVHPKLILLKFYATIFKTLKKVAEKHTQYDSNYMKFI